MMHPTKSHLATLNGMTTQPLVSWMSQLFWIEFDQLFVDNIVVAVKISDMYTKNDLNIMQ